MKSHGWACVTAGLFMGSFALAWDCPGHRMITLLALDALPEGAPSFLRDEETRKMAASQACEPDRWRGVASLYLKHENDPDHYIDAELLEQFGLSLRTLPHLRNEYLRAMALAKHQHPERIEKYNDTKDPARTQEWPGFAPYAVAEHYAKLQASFRVLAILERLSDPVRAAQAAQARANVVYEIGVLSHFVGDLSQPLHCTKHFNGWAGENPKGYTTWKGFHAKIDGGVIAAQGINYEGLKAAPAQAPGVNAKNPWEDVLGYIERSLALVEPLYDLEKRGALDGPEGKAFIEERLRAGGAMLGAMLRGAMETSAPSEKDIADFVRFDKYDGARAYTPAAPAPTPAPPPEPAKQP